MFHQVLSMVALEEWGNAARFITTSRAFEPDVIDPETYDLENDPLNLHLDELREASIKRRRNKIIARI